MIKTKMMTLKFAIALLSFAVLNTELSATDSPLNPGCISFEVKGGIEPGYYPCRRSTDVRNTVSICEVSALDSGDEAPPDLTTGSLLTIQRDRVKAPCFSDQFDLPWTVGGTIGYAVSCNSEVFLECNYMRAHGRTDKYTVAFPEVVGPDGVLTLIEAVKPEETIVISEKYSDLQSYTGYIGCRYYFARCCGASAFFGSKVGVRHWDSVSSHTQFTDTHVEGPGETNMITEEFDLGRHTYFDSTTAVSGGLQAGINYCFSDTCFLTLTAEVIGSCGFHYGKDVSTPNLDISDSDDGGLLAEEYTVRTEVAIPVRHVGSVLTFPITLGIKKTF